MHLIRYRLHCYEFKMINDIRIDYEIHLWYASKETLRKEHPKYSIFSSCFRFKLIFFSDFLLCDFITFPFLEFLHITGIVRKICIKKWFIRWFLIHECYPYVFWYKICFHQKNFKKVFRLSSIFLELLITNKFFFIISFVKRERGL